MLIYSIEAFSHNQEETTTGGNNDDVQRERVPLHILRTARHATEIIEEKKMEEERTPCGCGRSSTGYCTGLHEMTEEEYETYLMEHFDEDPDQIGN